MIKHGGRAFPRPFSTVDWGEQRGNPIHDQEGMTYRQWLVGQILPALIAYNPQPEWKRKFPEATDEEIRQLFADEAHKLADAVIEHQEKEPL